MSATVFSRVNPARNAGIVITVFGIVLLSAAILRAS
jgi:hypothetical protein